ARSSQTGEYVQYYTHVPGGLGSISFALVMNEDRWNSLSEEHRQIIQSIADELPTRFGEVQDADEESALASLNLTVEEASPELVAALRERLAGFEAEWIATASAAGIANPQEVLD